MDIELREDNTARQDCAEDLRPGYTFHCTCAHPPDIFCVAGLNDRFTSARASLAWGAHAFNVGSSGLKQRLRCMLSAGSNESQHPVRLHASRAGT
jgi:hypothetical protein